MGTVRATYVGQGETGTTFLGDFSAELQELHAGAEVDVEVTPVSQEEVRAEAEAPAEGEEATPANGTETPAQ